MKRISALLVVVGLVAVACGDDDAAGSLDTCEGIADATIVLIQDVIDELESMSPSDVGALTQGSGDFPAFTAFEERGAELGTAGQDLGCDTIDALVQERADRLEADPANGFTQLIVQGTKDGQDIFARLFRN